MLCYGLEMSYSRQVNVYIISSSPFPIIIRGNCEQIYSRRFCFSKNKASHLEFHTQHMYTYCHSLFSLPCCSLHGNFAQLKPSCKPSTVYLWCNVLILWPIIAVQEVKWCMSGLLAMGSNLSVTFPFAGQIKAYSILFSLTGYSKLPGCITSLHPPTTSRNKEFLHYSPGILGIGIWLVQNRWENSWM